MGPLFLTLLALAASIPGAQKGERWPRPDQRVACGPLVFEVYVSPTAHVFHLVDQISSWDNACHGQYRANMTLSAADEELLARYAEVRSKRRWGQGLEQTFYTPLDLDDAVRAGKKAGNITAEEAAVIVPVLEHFAPRALELLESKRAVLERAFEELDRERFARAAKDLARFTGVKQLVVPTFPLASPTSGGGGMDGGRLRWELASDDLHFSVLLHEATHGFFMRKNDLLSEVVRETPGLTHTLLGEGFAYAVAPGIYDDGDGDNLRYNVTKDLANGEAWQDAGYGRQRMYALALRPLLQDALKRSTLEEFLPRARDVFLALREVHDQELYGSRPPGPPRLAIAGPGRASVRERLLESKFQYWIQQLDHSANSYEDVLKQLGAGDLFVLLVAGDDSERIPAHYASLSPVDSAEIERRLARGKTIKAEHETEDRLRVVLLAAPKLEQLEELVRESDLLGR